MGLATRAVLSFLFAMLSLTVTAATAQPCQRPWTPGWMRVTPGVCEATLSWEPVASATRYTICLGNQSTEIGTTTETTFRLTDPLFRPQMCYVFAVNDCGRSEYPTGALFTPTQGRAPRTTNLVATRDQCDRIVLSFRLEAALESGESLRLWRSPTSSLVDAIAFRQIGPGGPWNLTDTAPLPGFDTWYWVESVSPHCGSSFTGPVMGRVLRLDVPPDALIATDGTLCDGVFLTWSHGTCPARFRVLRGTSAEIGTAVVISPPEGLSFGQFIDTTAQPGVRHWYWVLAFAGPWVGPPGGPVPGERMESGSVLISPRHEWFFPVWQSGTELTAIMTFDFWGAISYQYQWRKNGTPLVDGDRISGANGRYLQIDPMRDEDLGLYDVVVTTACGITTSPALPLRWDSPSTCPPCAADYNQDGGVDGADVEAFYTDWESGAQCADMNLDGAVDGQDVEGFFRSWGFTSCS
jgi:hypothetical protein